MKHKTLPPIERLNETLNYDADLGVFTWRISTTNKISAGATAGTVMNAGYIHIQLDKVLYLGHRIAWFLFYGEDPGSSQLDHINGNRTDNRICNLRLAPRGEIDNLQNTATRKDCSSGHPGVQWSAKKNRWRAYVSTEGKQYHLGYFKTKDEAVTARLTGKATYHLFQPTERIQ
jgi:hypothetical protein